MSAGESARQEARRSRERAERLARRAEMFEKGAEGESRTAAALSALGPEWVVFHDVRWPGRRMANIDHIVVGPGGVFVIDSKNWAGDVRTVGPVLRQNGRSRERTVDSAADSALAVAELVPTHAHLVRSVLCFVGQPQLAGWVRDVMVCSTANVTRMLLSRPRLLDEARVRELAFLIDLELQSALETPRTPIAPPQPAVGARSRRGARVGSPSRAQRSRRSRRDGQASRPSPARLLAVLVGFLLLYLAIPTVLPAVGSVVSDVIVGETMPADKCASGASTGDTTRQAGESKRVDTPVRADTKRRACDQRP